LRTLSDLNCRERILGTLYTTRCIHHSPKCVPLAQISSEASPVLSPLSRSLVRARSSSGPNGPHHSSASLLLKLALLSSSRRFLLERVCLQKETLALPHCHSHNSDLRSVRLAISRRLSSSRSSSPARHTTGAPSAAPYLDQRRERLPATLTQKRRAYASSGPLNFTRKTARQEMPGKTTERLLRPRAAKTNKRPRTLTPLENASSRWWSSAQKRVTLTASPTRKSATH
jgi:hypothetical protein